MRGRGIMLNFVSNFQLFSSPFASMNILCSSCHECSSISEIILLLIDKPFPPANYG